MTANGASFHDLFAEKIDGPLHKTHLITGGEILLVGISFTHAFQQTAKSMFLAVVARNHRARVKRGKKTLSDALGEGAARRGWGRDTKASSRVITFKTPSRQFQEQGTHCTVSVTTNC